MEIQKARAVCNLVRLLYRMGMVSFEFTDRFVDMIQVKVFESESK